MRHPLLLCLFLCLPQWLKPPPASAAVRSTQVVVLESRTQGDVRTEDRARIGDALWAALDRLGIRRVSDADREAVLSGETGLRACLDRDDCLERLGRLLEATHVIGVSMSRTAPTAYKAEVRLFDVDVGESGAQIEWSCTACGIEDLAGKLDALVETAVKKDYERPRATLVVKSTPPNADVQVDGRKVGFTELERRVFAGPHDIIVSNSRLGLQPESMHIDLAGEQRLSVSLTLTLKVEAPRQEAPPVAAAPQKQVDDPPPPPPRPSRVKLGLGIPLLVLGLGGAGLGAVSMALNGTCVDSQVPCTTRTYDTLLPGVIELAVGGALLVTGLALIIADGVEQRKYERARRRELSLMPTLGLRGGGLALQYRF